ncbi:MAG: SsrA-binding protein [Bacteroidetes bacterium GWF2_33_16]|nr:MAG: SsrA-binding protein [Bacteroidetes bacterium GWE2_32_14]OFY02361.1 MAG: SsrA-binding protein [Bacteroidetes bacterium GWF2_33_16]
MQTSINIKNKKAGFSYEFIDKYIAGIKLTGTEIKSIRGGKANLIDTYCYFVEHELYVRGLNISEYSFGTHYNHEPKRDRKLLLTRRELNKLEKKVSEKGLTIVALRLFITESGWAKLEIALAKGKQEFDKREDIKKKDVKRDLDRLKRQ